MTVLGCKGCAFEPEDSTKFPCNHPDAKQSWFHQQGNVRKTCYYDYKTYSGFKKKIAVGESRDNQMREEGAKAERERVLKAVNYAITKCSVLPNGVATCIGSASDLRKKIEESLRHGQERDP